MIMSMPQEVIFMIFCLQEIWILWKLHLHVPPGEKQFYLRQENILQ